MKTLFTKVQALIFCAVLIITGANAQVKKAEPCASTKIMTQLVEKNPQYKALFDLQEKNLQALIKNAKAQKTSTNGPVYTIPVVVHVFHTGQTQGAADPDYSFTVPNPTDAQVLAAVDLANSDFNKRANVARYTGGDSTGIKLCLATKDPNGTSMPGGAVTRWDGRQTSTWTNTSDPSGNAANYDTYGIFSSGNVTGSGVSSDDLPLVVKWDPTKYYNIYLITQIDSSFAGAGVKGFAYLPGDPSHTYDYAVMDPSSFSASDVSTFVHEMGHALGLKHTFTGHNDAEDYTGATCPDRETACDSDGDYICDIPQHKSSYPLFCQTIPADNTVNTCLQATGSPASPAGTHGEFNHNFMNYGGCPNTFSADQATRMRALFGVGQYRASLVTTTNIADCGCDGTVPTDFDLVVTEQVNAGPYYNAQNITYTVTAHNAGPDNAITVGVSDIIPSSGVSFVSSNPSVGTYNAGTNIWSVGNITTGATHTLTVVAKINTTGLINTCSTIFSTIADNNGANNSACANITAGQSNDVSITNTASTGPFTAGQNVTYTLVANNAGPNSATSVTATDQLPSGLSFVSSNPTMGSYNSGTGVWTIGTLSLSASATLTITAQVNPSGSVQNCATITANEHDNDASNNSSCNTIAVVAANDLAIQNNVSGGPYNVGQNLTYTLIATNNGPGDAGGVLVTDNLPAGVQFMNASTTSGAYSSGTGIWNIGNLSNGATATLTLTAQIISSGSINNCASIAASGNSDPTSGNNSSCTNITATPISDLSISKTVSNGPYSVGVNVTYTLIATNNGPSNATGVLVTDVLPAGLSFVSSNPAVGTYNSGSGIWNIGSLNASATGSMTLVCTPIITGTINNCASIDGIETDNVGTNDNDCVSIGVSPATTPTADFTVSGGLCNYNSSNTLTYTSTSIGLVSIYNWDFGTGATPATANTQGPHSVSYSTLGAKTATLTVSNGSGTNSINKTATINPAPVKPTISANGNTLTSSASSGNQWFMNSNAVGGATNQNHTAIQSGTYTVLVTDQNGCTMFSDPIVHTVVGINDLSGTTFNMSAFPNPFSEDITVSFSLQQNDLITLSVLDYTGKVVALPISNRAINAGTQEVKLNASQYSLKQGMYLLKLSTKNGSQLLKVSLVD